MVANKKSKKKELINGILWNALVILIAFFFVFPFIYMVMFSFANDDSEILSMNPRLFPISFRAYNYIDAFKEMHFLRALGNTLLIMIPVIILNMFGSLLAAYGFARFNGKFKNVLFSILISTMMLPWVVTMVPAFVVFKKINWIGTLLPLIVPAFGGSAYNIFMMRQFLIAMPKELDEAAKIDGCSSFKILFKILLPNMKPCIVTLFIFLFTSMWSDYIGPSLYIMKDSQQTLSLALLNFQNSYSIKWNLTLAGATMFTIPMIITLFALQKEFVGNSMNSAIK
ncbi:MAG: carbohydrate ABC transporter permease [Candidatus Caccosoma sp.]|nr:carbohydrate ABC transporter permease [Candidatus Caccosoma sp.]